MDALKSGAACWIFTAVMSYRRFEPKNWPNKRNKDSFDRLSEAKERQSYQGLNEPGTTLLSFAFAALEDNPDGWSGQRSSAWSLKHWACSWTEPGQSEAKALGIGPEG